MQYTHFITLVAISAIVLNGCGGETKTAESLKITKRPPVTPSISCEVTTGPNKGKKGTRTEDGWCKGDWGGTECRPRSNCKTVESGGAGIETEIPGAIGETGNVGSRLFTGNAIVGIVPSVNGAAAVDYCIIEDNLLSVRFHNSGDAIAKSKPNVQVTFIMNPNQTVTKQMPEIPVDSTIDMEFEIPARCFNADCDFSIKWSNQPAVAGRCIG